MSVKISRKAYAQTYGPTKGDGIRPAATELIIEIEHDYADYGENPFRRRQVDSRRNGSMPARNDESDHCDLVIITR